MEKEPGDNSDLDMGAEHDFSTGVRGKYSKRYAEGSNVVVLDPDVVDLFPDSASVNHALRALAGIIRRSGRPSP